MRRWLAKLKRIRFVYRRSSNFTKTAVATALLLSVVALVTLGIATENARQQAQALKDQAAQLEQDNDRLEENIDSLGSADSVDQIAKDELGLVDPDTVIVKPES